MDTTMSPAYILRSYAWEVLSRNMPETWDKSKYGGLTPIVPLAEEPELTEYDGPRIVYGFATNPSGDLYARKFGSMSFAIYDQNFRRLTRTLTILQTAFERKDESARDINEYSSTLPPFHGINFGYVELAFTDGGTPENEEGGRQSALITISFEYHVDYDVITSISDPRWS